MANYIISFYGSSDHESEDNFLNAFVNKTGGLFLTIQDRTKHHNEEKNQNFVVLDRSTAIRLVKELKREIAKMQE